ncbi:hypothetical protein [Pseudoalteromonas marina]|uniref:hypothetical protein n=1 Tax=Pseudoalteromonas marina TaxID=267375 RepID=UPI0023F4FAB0|nr:hypothetical protein [Pseudoalteromonas marina]
MADFFLKWLPSLLIIFGWMIILYNANRTSKRSEVRNLSDKCIEKIEKLHEDLLNNEPHEEINIYKFEASIIAPITLIEIKDRQLERKTGTKFLKPLDISRVKSLSKDTNEKEEICDTLLDMIESIESSFDKLYPCKYSFSSMYKLHTFLSISGILLIYFILTKLLVT